jgi:hypothetical protein
MEMKSGCLLAFGLLRMNGPTLVKTASVADLGYISLLLKAWVDTTDQKNVGLGKMEANVTCFLVLGFISSA